MSRLWTPPGAPSGSPSRPVKPKAGPIRLANGRVLVISGQLGDAGYRWYCEPMKLNVIASLDDTPAYGPLYHVSLSHPNKLPDWETVRLVRDAYFPADVDVMMVLPREEDYVNFHQYTFHLWQTPTVWGMR